MASNKHQHWYQAIPQRELLWHSESEGEAESHFWNTGVQHQENRETIRWSGTQTLFAEPFLQTKFQVESQDMKNEVKVMMKLGKMSLKVLFAWISLFCLSLLWRGSMYFQLAVSYWKWIRKLTQRNGICVSSPSNFQHVLIGLCSVAVSHLFCPLFSCYEILATYWKKVVFNIYSSNFVKC